MEYLSVLVAAELFSWWKLEFKEEIKIPTAASKPSNKLHQKFKGPIMTRIGDVTEKLEALWSQ